MTLQSKNETNLESSISRRAFVSRLAVGALVLCGGLNLAACGQSSSGGAKKVNIGYFNNVTHAQALYAKATKAVENALGSDVEVTWTAFNAGPAEQEALFAGEIDLGYIGPVPAVTACAKSKGDVQVAASATKGGAILVRRAGTNIKSVADLSGMTVAIPQIGNTQHLCLLNLLSEAGLAPDTEGGTVTVSAVANADVANLFTSGELDAALVPEPWGATLIKQGAEMVLDYKDIFYDGDYDVAVVVVRKDFAKENPDIVKSFLQVHEDVTKKLNSDLKGALSTINQELNDATGKSLEEDIIQEAFTRIGLDTEINKEALASFAQISLDQDFIDSIPSDDELYYVQA